MTPRAAGRIIREELVREVCAAADTAPGGPLVILGSLPPGGTDLDLLVAPEDDAGLRAALRDAGLVEKGSRLAHFGFGTGFEVELQAPADWGLPNGELAALFGEARPVAGWNRLMEPAPHHRLLILARLLAGGAALGDRRRERVRRALEADPDAWDRARACAPAWDAETALAGLENAYRGRPRRRLPRRLPAALAALLASRGRGGVVAFSGLDGAGKSTQARALQAALADLGWPVEIEWTPLASNWWLHRVAEATKALAPRHGAGAAAAEGEPGGETGLSAGSPLRQRNRLVNYVWAMLVALANGIAHARRSTRHRAAGRVVVFDRYLLDSVVRLRLLYGRRDRLRLQRALVRLLSPPTTAAFLLEIPPERSVARKRDVWELSELERQTALYRDEHARLGVIRLDGERPAAELGREIAERVWLALR